MRDFKESMAMLGMHSQVFVFVSRNSSAGEMTLSIDNLDADTLCVLEHSRFATPRSISQEVSVLQKTVHRRVTELLELRPPFLKWVQHFLILDLKITHVDLAKKRLDILRFEERMLFHRIITGNQSWFYLDYSSEDIWTCATDNVPQGSVIRFSLTK
jgi:hypothetical protein